ncbi:hypothetical protein [Streptomyces sp. NPDC002328]|uniref:hypothetical protein n=1 Tax=Streptomyces sp. NPDC002328 TaxID=3364642 RepID=UPI0036C46BB2
MRSARMLFATAAASAVLAITTPGAAFAVGAYDHDDSSYSKEDKEKDKEYGKEEDKEEEKDKEKDKDYDKEDKEYGKEHGKDDKYDSPRGGMHTGGGALALTNDDEWATAKDPKHDPETYKSSSKDEEKSWSKDEEKSWSKDSENDKESWGGGHDKPSGGVHTGGGALAAPGVTAGGLAVLAVAGTGVYAMRRRRTAGSVA